MAHRYRLYAILLLLALDAAALIAAHYGVSEAQLEGLRPLIDTGLATGLALLLPALGDALVVERRRRDPSMPALPDDIRDGEPATSIRRTRPPPLALLLFVLSLTSGCGASALGLQADLVAVGGIATATADGIIVRARDRELDAIVDRARVECGAEGCSEERSVAIRAELAAAESRWVPVLACRPPVVEALRSWADGIETAIRAATEALGLELVGALAERFVASYEALIGCVRANAPEVQIPSLAPALTAGGES